MSNSSTECSQITVTYFIKHLKGFWYVVYLVMCRINGAQQINNMSSNWDILRITVFFLNFSRYLTGKPQLNGKNTI